MKSAVSILVITFLTQILYSCKDNLIPPEDQPRINLTLEDASCTEAWIKLTTENITLPAEVILKQDDSTVKIISLSSSDSLLYFDSLLPNHTYEFQSIIQSSSQSSNSLDITTMDTTSHNFAWQTWTFGGQAGSCNLYDVAVIDENDIWAVGEIYLLNTTGVPDPNAYNAVHWDGNQWELIRIKTNACGGVVYPPVRAVFAFSGDDILFAHIDGSISHYNGIEFTNNCSLITQLNGSANKIWGKASNDFYVVSNNGFIAHYQYGQWSSSKSGTDLNINNIYGAYNDRTNEWEILAVASDYGLSFGKEILKIGNNEINKLTTYSNPEMEPLLGVWFIPNRQYYVVGSGIYQKHSLSENIWKNNRFEVTTYATTSIIGNGINDVVAVGAFGDLVHFNGISWKNDYEEPLLSNGSYTKVTIKGDLLVAVGGNYTSINSEAVILIGRR